MQAKAFVLRDGDRSLPVIAIKAEPANEQEQHLLDTVGRGTKQEKCRVIVMPLAGEAMPRWGPGDWDAIEGRGNRVAHEYLTTHFDALKAGAVIDVQRILQQGAAAQPTASGSQRQP